MNGVTQHERDIKESPSSLTLTYMRRRDTRGPTKERTQNVHRVLAYIAYVPASISRSLKSLSSFPAKRMPTKEKVSIRLVLARPFTVR